MDETEGTKGARRVRFELPNDSEVSAPQEVEDTARRADTAAGSSLGLQASRAGTDFHDNVGALITGEHTDHGRSIGTEIIKRLPGVTLLKTTLKRMQSEFASAHLAYLEADPVAQKRGFFGSYYHRQFMSEKIKRLGGSLDAARYAQLAAQSSPGLVNAREAQLLSHEREQLSTTSLLRLGVMSYLPNGATNLKQLREAVKNPADRDRLISDLQKKRDKYKSGTPAHASYQMAIDELEKGRIASTVARREEWMTLLMLQYLCVQAGIAEGTLNTLENEGTWSVVDVRLLNPKKDEVDRASGWVHHEGNELRDMQAIFEDFDGKTIVLDGTGPSIDGDTIHLPLEVMGVEGKPKEVKLGAKLLNISVQGHTKNDSVQEEINRKAIEDLARDKPELAENPSWQKATRRLAKGKSGYQIADHMVSALTQTGFTISTGCLSAKDRTGLVVGSMFARKMAGNSPNLRRKLRSRVMGKRSPAARVVGDVSATRVLKVNPLAAKNLSLKDRIIQAARLSLSWIGSKFRALWSKRPTRRIERPRHIRIKRN